MSDAAWLSDPLLGTAMRSGAPFAPATGGGRVGLVGGVTGSSEVGVDVVEAQAGGEHEHLGVVEQLADLLGGALGGLVLGGHPRLRGLLDQLLADRMHPGVELTD